MIYELIISPNAVEDISFLKKTDKLAYKKVEKLLSELREHPKTGSGKPELKKYDLSGLYSRRITQKHRLIYQILEEKVVVLVLSAKGHYDDK
jgi:toxin YoeB